MRNSGRPDYVYLGLAAAIVLFGLTLLSSASGPSAFSKFDDSFWFVKHQLLFGLLPGAALFLFFQRFDYHKFRVLALPLLIATVILLVLVFIPGLAASWGTSRSWISVGPFSLQPSEIAKLTFILYLAAWLERRGEKTVRDFQGGTLPFLALLGVVATLLLLEPDLGTMSIIAAAALAVYFAGGAPMSHLVGMLGAGAGAFYLLIKIEPYRANRLLAFLHPELDPQGVGYHINQALLAVGSGGFWGLGFGRSRQKFLYLPEVAGDSIFAVMAEELGFLFAVGTLALFLALAWRGLRIARSAPDRLGMLIAVGITSWLGIQALVNIGSMVGLMPLTGLTLPFISYGGTSLAVSLAAVGVMVNISRQAR